MSTVCYVCFVVLVYFILFDVGCSCVLNQNALPVVLENTIVQNLRLGVVNDSDPCLPIVRNVVVFVDSRKVFFALYYNPIFQVFLNPVELDYAVGAQFVLGVGSDALLLIPGNFVHNNHWVCTNAFYPVLAVQDVI